MSYHFDWSVISSRGGLLLAALGLTFKVSVTAELLGLAIGLFVALVRMQPVWAMRWVAIGFIEVFRSVPLLVLLIWIYYGLPIVAGMDFSPFAAGVLGLGLLYGANLAEVFRAGLQAVPAGQREAALTLGLGRIRTGLLIVIPQAVRIVVPALGNSFVAMLKDATLVSVLGLAELMRTAQTVVAETFRPFEVYTFVALVYLALTLIIGRALDLLERKI
jgi:His/Glu/Gln/Arg/opine family amino acid ABC transporter permease subunit